MGLFSFIKNQLIDVIEWLDDSNNILVWRFPDQDHEIKMGARLTVREGQAAVFVNEGQIADVYPPGLYSLSTQNMPVLTTLKSWKYGFTSPFKAEVYFVNTRQYLDLKWGTQNPIIMRDKDFGVVRVRAFGVYAIRVKDPSMFLREVVGTDGMFTTQEIEGQLRRMLVSSFTNAIGQAKIPVLDLAGNYDAIARVAEEAMQPEFAKLGVQLAKFLVENVSLPAEVEKAIDERGGIAMAGDLNQYTQYQAAKGMREAASQPGGMAGAGIGLGAGLGMGQMLVSAVTGALQQPHAPQPAAPAAAAAPAAGTTPCPKCGAGVAPGAKFCPECGQKLERFCPHCGQPAGAAKFCGECGGKIG